MRPTSILGLPGALPGEIVLGTGISGQSEVIVDTPISVTAGGLLIANAIAASNLGTDLTASLNTDTAVIVASAAVTISEDSILDNGLSRYTARAVAPLTEGTYLLTWVDALNALSASQPVLMTIGVRPALADVAALVRARTKVAGGREIGTFNANTRPTDDEVEGLIDSALDDVLGKVQPIDPSLPAGSAFNATGSAYERRIRRAVALYAAILVELSYWPEQVRSGQSPATTLQQLYESRIRALIAEGETGRAEGEGAGGPGGDAPADAYYSFPAAAPGALVGWGSKW